jgi:hypothetical protein
VQADERFVFLFNPSNARLSIFEITPENQETDLGFRPSLTLNGYTESTFGQQEKDAFCQVITTRLNVAASTCNVTSVTNVDTGSTTAGAGSTTTIKIDYEITLTTDQDVANSKVIFDTLEELTLATDPASTKYNPPYLRADVTFDVTIAGVNLAELDTPQKVTDFKAGQQAVYATRFEVAVDRVRIALRSGSIIVEATIDAPAAQVAAVQATLGNATARAELMAATVQQATTDLQTATGQTFVLTATAPAEAVVVPTEVNPNSNPLGDLQTALVAAGVTGDDPVNNPITVTGAAKPKPTHGSGEWTAPLPVEETGELAPVPPSNPTPTPTLPANPFPPGAIVGIVLGGVFVLAAGLLFVRRLQKKQEREKGGVRATTAKKKNKPELELVGV